MYEKAQPKKKKERKGITNLVINQPFPEYPITSEIFELVLRYLYADDLQFETMSGRQVFLLPSFSLLFPLLLQSKPVEIVCLKRDLFLILLLGFGFGHRCS